jgi:hypothetical protein
MNEQKLSRRKIREMKWKLILKSLLVIQIPLNLYILVSRRPKMVGGYSRNRGHFKSKQQGYYPNLLLLSWVMSNFEKEKIVNINKKTCFI